jgi:hypothetical protein
MEAFSFVGPFFGTLVRSMRAQCYMFASEVRAIECAAFPSLFVGERIGTRSKESSQPPPLSDSRHARKRFQIDSIIYSPDS